MNCPCDRFDFPPPLYIPAGLPQLPRQIASFPEFRRALLHDVGAKPSLQMWRGRQPDDFGMMLIEMWAYVCDVTAFYDQVAADEAYVRTAVRRESLCRLVALLGYRSRPAVGASVALAAFADGRRAVKLPTGTAFRSDAFDGHPPQVFELTAERTIHPFFNAWTLQTRRPDTFGPIALNLTYLLCVSGSVTVKQDDLVLVRIGPQRLARNVKKVAAHTGADGARYSKVEFASAISIPAHTPVMSVSIAQPTFTAGLWPKSFDSDNAFSLTELIILGAGGIAPHTPYAYLDTIYQAVRAGQDIIFAVKDTLAARRILGTSQQPRIATEASSTTFKDAANNVITVPIPATKTTVTKVILDSDIEVKIAFALGSAGGPFASADLADIAVHLGFVPAGVVTVEAATTLAEADLLHVALPIEQPLDADFPGQFQLEDKNLTGVAVNGTLDPHTGVFELGQDAGWDPALTVPVKLYGNIVTATRGETVHAEPLGFGDAALASQTFKLKKSPLTYLPSPTQGNDLGVANTLKVYVDNIQWSEVRSFFNVPSSAEVYIVRENEDGESSVTFGDGSRGARLPTGAPVIAHYRFGAEAAMPPAGGIHQIARPAKGLSSIRNPVAAAGGADAEPVAQLRRYAPRSALLLGRAVSLADLEAAASSAEGVRNVRAEWRWNLQRQSPVAQIFYIGEVALDEPITQRLRGLTQPDTPIDVTPATPVPATLAIQITVDPRHLEATVLAEVRSSLMDPLNGLLAPERVGIGLALFRSRIFEFVCAIPGATAVTDLQFNHAPFGEWGITPGVGRYFDFERGAVFLNGRDL